MAASELSVGTRLDWINHFINVANAVDHNVKKACGLNITQGRILFYISTHELMTIGNVGTMLFLKASTITASVNKLVDEGYISRSHDDADRRNVFIASTRKGIEVTPSFIPAVRKAYEEDVPRPRPERLPELRTLLLPASSRIFFDTEVESFEHIAARVAKTLNLDETQDEIVTHISRVLAIESISYFMSKMAEFDSMLGLTPNEARILRALGNDNSGMKLKDISTFLNIRSNVASMSIRTLEDNGYIDRGRDREDRRAARVTLTAHGTKLMADTRDEYCEIFDTCFPGISQHEFSEFFLV